MTARRWMGPAAVGFLAVALSGCGGWMGAGEGPPLPGERAPVILYQGELEPDARLSGEPVLLPEPYRNTSWSQVGGGPLHAVGHVEGPVPAGKPAWRVDIGAGAGRYRPLLTEPVVADGKVYTMDSRFRVSAYEAGDGKRLWRTRLDVPKRDGTAFGGGIAYHGGRIYVGAGFAVIAALDAADGSVLWNRTVAGPVRGAPLVMDDKVFAIMRDNQLVALSAEDGEPAWRHAGFAESAALLGSSTPAGLDGSVIVPYSSGEIYALRAANGRPNWSDNLAAVRRIDATSALADIRALPVTDGNLVYAISHSGRTVAINLRSGARLWEKNVGGVRTPWIAGEWMFMLSNENQLVTLSRRNGAIRWIAQLDSYEDEKKRTGPIRWIGPMVLSGRLLVFGGHGEGLSIDPADGAVVERFKLPGGVMAAAVADGTLYLQTEDAALLAYR